MSRITAGERPHYLFACTLTSTSKILRRDGLSYYRLIDTPCLIGDAIGVDARRDLTRKLKIG